MFPLDIGSAHVVARGVGLDGVLRRQSDAAHGNDYQDAHFKVAQVDHVMAEPPHPETTTYTHTQTDRNVSEQLTRCVRVIRTRSWNNSRRLFTNCSSSERMEPFISSAGSVVKWF